MRLDASQFASSNAISDARDRGHDIVCVVKDTSLHFEKPLYRRCPRNDVGSPRHYGAVLFRATPLRGGTTRCRSWWWRWWCTGMQRVFSRPSARDPDRVPLDLFAVNEIKGPIIEFFGKLLPPRPGSGPFPRDAFPRSHS